jgi:hypothetical protein
MSRRGDRERLADMLQDTGRTNMSELPLNRDRTMNDNHL